MAGCSDNLRDQWGRNHQGEKIWHLHISLPVNEPFWDPYIQHRNMSTSDQRRPPQDLGEEIFPAETFEAFHKAIFKYFLKFKKNMQALRKKGRKIYHSCALCLTEVYIQYMMCFFFSFNPRGWEYKSRTFRTSIKGFQDSWAQKQRVHLLLFSNQRYHNAIIFL